MKLNTADIIAMDDRYRAKFINSLSGFKSANLIGTTDGKGNHNLAIVSSVFHIGANPPLVGMISRPHTVTRDTLENLQATGVYTINQVSADMWKQAHQTSARYPAEVSEFVEAGLTPECVNGVAAPYVAESRVKFALEVREVQNLAINDTELIIGEVVQVLVDEKAITADGYIDIEALKTVAISGLDSYHDTHRLARLSYAKPNTNVEEIE
ncbi:flavin reductase family protein [Enterovibrio sp. ZSDZ42]|uniref:Flavin reductase family protein n=1 Tax=Enterovibrio gelatinilyticus TaxID=2899819 RepID=A0ABT5R0A4_9GAMM|nr:flavin reductase family protein [Enterovibrio sp. ZSDZ42]MDD1793181.1 flavin reductase family protein [Enterovibrio sp. ZSDZ42]